MRFVTGDLDIENDWDSYIQQMKDLQVEEYLEIYNAAYEAKYGN